MKRASTQARLEEARPAIECEQLVELIADIGHRIILRTPAGLPRTNICLLCRHGPVPLRHQPCRHGEFFEITEGGGAGVDIGRLKDLVVWLGPRLVRRNDNGMPSDRFCLMCTMGVREFQVQRTLGPRQPCRHEEIWKIAGL